MVHPEPRDDDAVMVDRGPLTWEPVQLCTDSVQFDSCCIDNVKFDSCRLGSEVEVHDLVTHRRSHIGIVLPGLSKRAA
jgi:hypothetical protein